jgi:hypothetical protein
MTPLPLESFLVDLPWSDNLRHVLRVTADRDNVKAITAHRKEGKLTAQAWTRLPRQWPDEVEALWVRPRPGRSKTMQAVDLVLKDGLTVYAAAKKIGVNQSAVHRAIQRRDDREICPCCGQVVRDGYAVKIPRSRSVFS